MSAPMATRLALPIRAAVPCFLRFAIVLLSARVGAARKAAADVDDDIRREWPPELVKNSRSTQDLLLLHRTAAAQGAALPPPPPPPQHYAHCPLTTCDLDSSRCTARFNRHELVACLFSGFVGPLLLVLCTRPLLGPPGPSWAGPTCMACDCRP